MAKLITAVDWLWRRWNPSETPAYIGTGVAGGPSSAGLWSEGVVGAGVRSVSADIQVDDTYGIVEVDCTGGNRTVYLPDAVLYANAQFVIRKIDAGANSVSVITTGGQTIDGAGFKSSAVQWVTFWVYSNGTQWRLLTP